MECIILVQRQVKKMLEGPAYRLAWSVLDIIKDELSTRELTVHEARRVLHIC